LTGATTSFLVFGALVGSACCGAAVRVRAPGTLASTEGRDVIRRVLTLIGVLAALMLGMSIASLKSTFDGADRDIRRLASQIEELDRTLRRIDPPATEARQLLFRFTAVLVRDTFPDLDAPFRGEPRGANDLQDDLDASLERLAAGPAVPRIVVEAQAVLHAIVQTRWSMEEEAGPTVTGWQLGVLIFWLMLIFAGLGLFAPRNFLLAVVLGLSAVALTFAIFLLTEFGDPFKGVITVSGEPLVNALHMLADN
jgi:multisubunit Na+/H+ antiporter MnhE subunit